MWRCHTKGGGARCGCYEDAWSTQSSLWLLFGHLWRACRSLACPSTCSPSCMATCDIRIASRLDWFASPRPALHFRTRQEFNQLPTTSFTSRHIYKRCLCDWDVFPSALSISIVVSTLTRRSVATGVMFIKAAACTSRRVRCGGMSRASCTCASRALPSSYALKFSTSLRSLCSRYPRAPIGHARL